MLNLFPQLPVAEWVEAITAWLTTNLSALFNLIQTAGQGLMDGITSFLLFIPPFLFIALLTIFIFFVNKKRWGLPFFSLVGLLYIYNQRLWPELMDTVTLVIVAAAVSVIIGVPLGIWMSKSKTAEKIIQPILDFMQTMPAFVYLIPAVAFFGIGMVPGVFASVIFSLPPTVRMTNLGIQQVDVELREAADAFGSTPSQKLFKVELPLAKASIFAGINQTIMLALSMVVTASMIGAPGLGRGVLSALQRSQVGNGFVNGLAIVILAIIIDRLTQKLNQPVEERQAVPAGQKSRRKWPVFAALAVVLALFGINQFTDVGPTAEGEVELSYVEWDTEIASTNVVATVLEDLGYDVTMTPLDNAIMWESVVSGETDGMVAAWLPNTHGEMYAEHGDDLIDLGPNLEGADLGITVPAYMDVDSIEDLTTEADQQVTGIEAGAGVVAAAQDAVATYPNLSDWEVVPSSSGAMVTALGQAIDNQEEIVITGWTPHWMFQAYDLKYLEDPLGSMGEAETINTMVREGLEEDMPEVYTILDNFFWEMEDMESVMLEISEGADPQTAARNWVTENPDKVESWLEGTEFATE